MSKLIVANWKMNGSINQVQTDLFHYANTNITNKSNVVLALPSIYLHEAAQIVQQCSSNFNLASQDISQFNNVGAYTGENSATMLKEFLIKYTIIGHSERRTLLNESGSVLLNKLENALLNHIIPIFCIGENIALRDNNSYMDFLIQQLELLTQLKTPVHELVIAYEPLWSIGTGIIPSISQISEVVKLIHAFVQNYLPHAKITVLYGGSVSAKNVHDILSQAEIGGVLVGGASLKVDEFSRICAY